MFSHVNDDRKLRQKGPFQPTHQGPSSPACFVNPRAPSGPILSPQGTEVLSKLYDDNWVV